MAQHPSNRNRGPRGSTGPRAGRGAAPRTGHRGVGPQRRGARTLPSPTTPSSGTEGEEQVSRWTSRAAVLVLVLAVLLVSYASSMRAYLNQRSHINEVQAEIARTQAQIEALEDEKAKWSDPAYVEQQARERLGYVKPGERTYLVLDENGEPLRPSSRLDDPATVLNTTPTPWWSDAWASVELAGDPPSVVPPPESRIDGAKENGSKENQGS